MAWFRAFFFYNFFAIFLLAARVNAILTSNPQELSHDTYDFIIVGGGTAGNVIANRLSNNTGHSVLVVEAGPSNEGVMSSIVPFLHPTMRPFSAYTWNYSTVAQEGLNGRELHYIRGRMLGGSSAINFMVFTRGSDDEYNRWADLTEDSSWAWENLERFYFQMSQLVPSADGHDPVGQVDPSMHGEGPVRVSLTNFPTQIDSRVIDSSKELSDEFTFQLDMNAGSTIGIGYIQSAVGGGERSSSAAAHITPSLTRPNLDVLVGHQVTKLLSSSQEHIGIVYDGVEFASSRSAPRLTKSARKEVIVSAGAIGSPHLLMLSGIGNATTLSELGITPLVDSPDVGRHLQDHPLLQNYFKVSSNSTTVDSTMRNSSIADGHLKEWIANRTGLFTSTGVNTLGFLRMTPEDLILHDLEDPSAGPGSGHGEFVFIDGFFPTPDEPAPSEGFYMTVLNAVMSSTSCGTIELRSIDPFDTPLIDPNFLSSAFDQQATIATVRATRRFVDQSPWEGYILSRFGAIGNAETDEEILAAARETYQTMWHPVGTARMGPANADWGVVDPRLRVKGVRGLRVVDASIMPVIPAVHTMAPVYIIAERAAAFILEDWNSSAHDDEVPSMDLFGNFNIALQTVLEIVT